MVQPFEVITTSPTNLQFGYANITTDTQLSTQVSFHIQRMGRFRHTDQQWWVIVNGSPKTFNYKMEGNYSDQHLISLVLYTCYSISHVCLSPNMAGASPITWPLTSCENTLYPLLLITNHHLSSQEIHCIHSAQFISELCQSHKTVAAKYVCLISNPFTIIFVHVTYNTDCSSFSEHRLGGNHAAILFLDLE